MRTMTWAFAFGGALSVLTASCLAGDSGERELGDVTWSRDVDASLAQAGISGKPALVLFQEVPG